MNAALTGLLLYLLSAAPALAADAAAVQALIEKLTADKAETRSAARLEAPALGAAGVVPLGELIGEPPAAIKDERQRREISIAARGALERLVHHAGRPGAEGEAAAVAAELEKLLTASRPAEVRREAVHLIAYVGGDAVVPQVAARLEDADKHVRETARLSLERIPGKAAVAALEEAAKRATDDGRADFLFSLGKKGDPSAAPFLAQMAQSSKGRARLGALEGLSRVGGPEAASAFAAILKAQDLPERTQVYGEYLRFADHLAAAGKGDVAVAILREALTAAPADHQRERALHQLTLPGSRNAIEVVLLALADPAPRVHDLALERLKKLEGAGVMDGLRQAYTAGKPETRPALLRAMHSRDAGAAAALIEEAARSPNDELKVTALDLRGGPADAALEPLYLKVAENGSPQVRPVALKGYLAVARARLDAGEKAHAHEMFSRALALATSDADRTEAVRGVIRAEDPRSLEVLGGFLKDPTLGQEAAKGFVAAAGRLGSSGSKEAAERHLLGIVTGDFQRDVKSQAMEQLRGLGRDPQQIVRDQGFVIAWHLLTPIQDPDQKGLETKYFPEQVIELDKESRIGPRKFIWQRYGDYTLDGVIDLIPSFRRSEKVISYAYTELESPSEQEVLLKMGSDDGIACFLNGELIHLQNVARSLKVDEDVVKAKLLAGKNRLLLKLSNIDGSWQFALRVTDPAGKPIALPPPRA